MKKIQLCLIALFVTQLGACSEKLHTFRCSCNKIAYGASGVILQDESFNQIICDTKDNMDSAFAGELNGLAKDCSEHFEDVSGVVSTDCTCTCEYLDVCN